QELRALPVSALAGVRVLDLTRFLAGPFCTAILADLGAEVIKVEAPRGGDEGRYGYPTADGVPVAFLALNRNQQGITLDLAQAAGGFMSLTGFPESPPTRGGGSLGDYLQGLFGVIGVLAALSARSRTGRGQVVDVSAQDAVFSILDGWPAIHAATGKLPARVGNRHLATAPYDCFRARDGWGVLAVARNRIFRRLAEAIGRPELGSDPRFRGSSGRLERSAEINELVGAWVAGHSVEEVTDTLGPARANVPCAPVYGVAALLRHPQILARDMVVRLPPAKLGEVAVPGVAVKLSDSPGAVRRLGPELGEHNEEIYAGLLGLGAEELMHFRAAEVI